MILNNKEVSAKRIVVLFLVLISAISVRNGYTDNIDWYWVSALAFPVLVLLVYKKRNANQPYRRRFRRHKFQRTRRQASEMSI
jgi:membrane protein YdbS with pleckstrin-like domain